MAFRLRIGGASLRRLVVALTAGALVSVSAIGVLLALWGQQRTFDEAERLLLETESRVVAHQVRVRERELSKVADAFIRPREIQDALAAKDRDGLLDAAKPPFNRLATSAGISHLAYHDASGARLLSLHQGDNASRSALVEAAVTGKQATQGLERSGGEPVIAVVQPVSRQGEIVGYVYVGSALQRLVPDVAATLSARGAVLVSPPGPTGASTMHGLALFGLTDPDVTRALAALPGAPELATASLHTVRLHGGAFAVALIPTTGTGTTPEGVVVLVSDVSRSASAIDRSMIWLLAVPGVVLLIALVVTATVLSRRLRPLREMVAMLQEIAEGEGDLTRRLDVDSRDEIGELARWFNEFVAKLHDIVDQVKTATASFATAARQVSVASEELAGAARDEATSLEATAASLEQLNGAVAQNAAHASEATELAAGSHKVAERGARLVTEAVASVNEISRASTTIGDIVTTIDDLAFQTNLLALNAAVEAARAGEQGRGFAVVAAEVRSLAQRSANAAREIKNLIQNSVGKIEHGARLVNQSGDTLGEIVTSVNRTTRIMQEIAAATQEQSRGIGQVSQSVAKMDQVVQATANQTQTLSATSQSLAGQAEQLHGLVGRFITDGDAAPSAAPRAHRAESRGHREADAPPRRETKAARTEAAPV